MALDALWPRCDGCHHRIWLGGADGSDGSVRHEVCVLAPPLEPEPAAEPAAGDQAKGTALAVSVGLIPMQSNMSSRACDIAVSEMIGLPLEQIRSYAVVVHVLAPAEGVMVMPDTDNWSAAARLLELGADRCNMMADG